MAITICKGQCVISFSNKEQYETNKKIYEKNLNWIPNLINANDEDKTLTIEKIGRSLAEKYQGSIRSRYLPKMRMLSKKFYNSFGIYHNDMRYKNVLEDSNGKLYLIDFEYATKSLEKNIPNYVRSGKLYNFNF